MILREYNYEASVIFSPSTVKLRRMIAEKSASEAEQYPEDFRGEAACIFYKYDYVFPYDKLDGLRRYILSVKDRTGLRNSYRGYIALDLSDWADHVDEEYFKIFIMYLTDHSDGIHYMLFFETRDATIKHQILGILRQYMDVRVVDDPMRLGDMHAPKYLNRETL